MTTGREGGARRKGERKRPGTAKEVVKMKTGKGKVRGTRRAALSYTGFPGGSVVKNSPANAGDQETCIRFLGGGDPLEKEMATHSSILACKIPWTEEPGGLQSTGSQRVGHN